MVDTTSSRRKRKLTCGSNDELPNHLADEESGDSTDEVRYSISRRQRTLRSRLTGRTGRLINLLLYVFNNLLCFV